MQTELKLGHTFAAAALASSSRERKLRNAAKERLADATRDRTIRNRTNARLAYDVANKYVRLLLLAPAMSEDLNKRFKILHAQLVTLGESF